MKSLVTAILLRFTFLCCSIGSGKDNVAILVQNNGNGNNNIAATKMKITIGTAVFAATLYDNSSATALKAMLPFTINMTELNGNEKYYDIPNSLPTNSLARGDVKAGDLMLYGNNTLVLFYKNFSTSYSYTKLGYVDNPTGLAAALGNGNVVVKIENN